MAYSDCDVGYGHELLLKTKTFQSFLLSHLLLVDGPLLLVAAYSNGSINCWS